MKRVFMIMVCLLSLVSASTGLNAQEISILLRPGWNWIGYPYPETVDMGTAFGDFEPLAGDVIESCFGYSEYLSGYGWYGGVNELRPGWGYMYYSNRTEAVTIVFSHPSTPVGSVTVTTSEPMLITGNSAMGGGEVTTNDGTYILVKGLCWATHENPTTNDDFYEEAESGVGTFSISMTELNIATTYYVRAYAVTPNGTVYGNQKIFTTRDGIPTLTTADITDITGESATSGGDITDDGGLNVTAKGVCWSTSPNPTLSDSHTSVGTGTGSFTSNITGMVDNTTYYVRAYASTIAGTAYGEEVSFTTLMAVVIDSITGIFGDVASCNGMVNINWVGYRGVCWSTSHNPTTNDSSISEDSWYYDDWGEGEGDWQWQQTNFVGDFTIQMRELSSSTIYYVRAFVSKNGTISYSNEVCITTPTEIATDGALPGVFSVSSNQQVHFSQGNLQYRASTNTWRFAINQWSFVGGYETGDWYYGEFGNVYSGGVKCQNNNISSTYSGWIDLFGWGTSGFNHGAVCYQPWSISQSSSDYYAYSNASFNLYDQTGQADWGYNAISNGGNQPNQWCTLTKDEWKYIFNTRSTTSGIRYAKAKVNDVDGVVLLPDDWQTSYYSLNNTNSSGASFGSNVISGEQWRTLELHGAVFLPTTGIRYNVGNSGNHYGEWMGLSGIYYWSSSFNSDSRAYHVNISNSWVRPQDYSSRHNGMAVRLVCFTTSPDITINVYANLNDGGTVNGGGSYSYGQTCSVHATPNTGYCFTNWTENGSVVSTDANYSFRVTDGRTLVANFTAVPTGAISGPFSVSASRQVLFSQGNLQYQASSNTWRFATNQYDYVGSDNSNISSTYSGWIDLFGWGTSGYHDSSDPYNVKYQPWSTSMSTVNTSYNYYGYGPSTNMSSTNLTGSSANYDWGVYNAISNGGNTSNQWRTLKRDEWQYVFQERTTSSGIRFAKAIVNDVNGVILLPDNWSTSTYSLSNTNNSGTTFSSNTITASQWVTLESAGAVFLPAAGSRSGTSVDNVGSSGYYWSTYGGSGNNGKYAYFVAIHADAFLSSSRFHGYSVRLVHDSE